MLMVTAYFVIGQNTESAQPKLSSTQIKLLEIGDKCVDFGERAIANDPVIVAFQMLVRESKKAGVIERCMADNGYQANPAWLKYAEPIAKTNAKQQNSSVDEALTILRRQHMQIFEPVSARPAYWVKQTKR